MGSRLPAQAVGDNGGKAGVNRAGIPSKRGALQLELSDSSGALVAVADL